MNYDNLRDLIQDGDVVFVSRGTSIWSKLTEFATHSPYFHAAFAFWMREPVERLMVVEATKGGRRICSLSSYVEHGHELTVLRLQPEVFKWNERVADILEKTGIIDYSIADYIGIGLYEIFGLKTRNFPGEVCSEMVAREIVASGAIELSPVVSPGKLYKNLSKLPFVTEIRDATTQS